MKRSIYLKLILTFFLVHTCIILRSQVPTCGSNVPYYQVNLSGNPNGVWYSPAHQRLGNCCGTTAPDNCTSFEITLDSNTVAIEFDIVSGAIPSGAMFYQINCGPPVPVGDPICLSGVGPHHITFCKPGNNENVYMIKAISKPIVPQAQHVRIGCSHVISIAGVDSSTMIWNSIYPGVSGQYNSYLSCTSGCANSVFTPDTNAPAYIDYLVTGTPTASSCGYISVSDTVRVYTHTEVSASVTPNPAGFCVDAGGTTLTASASGGYGQFTFIWRDTSNTIIGTSPTYFATSQGMYFVEIQDELYAQGTCPATFLSVPVIVTPLPTINAGADQSICTSDPVAYLNGTAVNSPGVIWTGGSGTFYPDNTNLLASYVPSAAELAAGSVTLTLTSTGVAGGCTNASDQVVLTFPPPLAVSMSNVNADCNNSSATLSPNVSGGLPPYSYTWSTGSNGMAITAPQGNYCVSVTDNMGCFQTVCANIIAPAPLNISMTSTSISSNGGSDGTATAFVSGGVGPYSYSWNPGGQTTATATGLSYGIYTVTVTDSRGCIIVSSIVVNEPRCSGFTGAITKTDVICHSGTTGSASVTASGGTAPYTYLWDDTNSQTTPTASGLGAGTYMVIVTDATGCLFSTGVSIFEPPQLTNVMNQTNVTTYGGSDGTASANTFGGTPGYTYSWSNGATTQSVNNLSAGTYVVTITDAKGCSVTDSIVINNAQCSTFVVAANVSNISCFGGADGSISITALHGTAPYSYQWNNGATDSLISNLAAGTYMVTVTDAANCVIFKNISIVQPATLSLALSPTDVTCYNAYDASIEMTISGGTFPYSYSWSNGITVEDLINLGPGTYSVTVTDNRGCSANASASVASPTALTLSSNITSATCNGGTGSVDITVNGGIAPYTYSWSNGATTEDLVNVTSNQYSVTVTDQNGCIVTPIPGFLVDQPDSVGIGSSDVDCPAPGSGVAQVTITPAGGWSGPYQISFDNGVTYQTAGDYDAILPVGVTYSVVIKDNNGCTSPAPEEVEVRPEITGTISYDKCFTSGSAQATITIVPSGGKSPYSISIDGGATYNAEGVYSFTVPINSTYTVVIKDKRNCVSVSYPVNIPAYMTLYTTLSEYNGYNVSCAGASDGSINLTVSGGTGPFSYSWSNGIATEDLSNLSAGYYTALVTDANGCTATISDSITQPGVFGITAISANDFNGYDISCNGFSNGAIDLSINGGTGPYTYSWSNGAATEDISNLTAATYYVTVTDLNGCQLSTSLKLEEPQSLTATVTSLTDFNGYGISCFGKKDGAIDLQVSGGVPGFSFSWNNGESSEDLSSIGDGTYTVTVQDDNNCITTASITLTEPADLTATAVSLKDYNGYEVSCAGSSDAMIDLQVSGGVAAYEIIWNNGTVSEDLSLVGAGNYAVTVTDQNGCDVSTSIVISEPPALNGTYLSSNYNGYNISCNGLADGSIDIAITGGTGTYTYNWSNGSTTEDQYNLGAGVYNASISDANGCTYSVSVTLYQPDSLTGSVSASNDYNGYDISCYGGNNGSIDLSVTGGIGPYFYQWSSGEDDEDVNALAAGTYSVIITDANNCVTTTQLTLTEPADLLTDLSLSLSYNGYAVSCNGMNDGAIDLEITGGAGAYTYSWNNSEATQDLQELAAGTYSVIVTDENGCTKTATITLTEPPLLSTSVSDISDYNSFNISCKGSSDGSVDVICSGGVSAYTYNWSNGTSAEDLTNTTAGTYTLTVTDANNCVSTVTVTLTEPEELDPSGNITSNFNGYPVSCYGMSDGAIDIEVSGGSGTYSYEWSNGNMTQDVSGLAAGNYFVSISDANGCFKTLEFTITQPESVQASAELKHIGCNGSATGTIDLSVSGGTGIYTYNWSNSGSTEDISGLSAGTYTVTVIDQNNCSVQQVYAIEQSPPMTVETTSSDALCSGNANGIAGVTVAGGKPGYTYSWSNGATAASLDSLTAGTYTVTVTDVNKCKTTVTITVAEPSLLDVSASPVVLFNTFNVTHAGSTDGTINTSINGGTGPYIYSWSNGDTASTLTNIGAGFYSLLVTDNNGCSDTISVTLREPDILEMPSGYSPNGDGKNDYFVVHGIESYPQNLLTIFNRWGVKVVEEKNYTNTWAGKTSSGSELPDGTYFVILELDNGPTLTGYVDLRR